MRELTKPMRVLRRFWRSEVDMVVSGWRGGSGLGRGGGSLRVEDGLQACDVLAVFAQEVRLLDLAGVLAQAELEELFAGLAELGGDLGRGEVADFLGSHGGHSPVNQVAVPSRTMKRQGKAVWRQRGGRPPWPR